MDSSEFPLRLTPPEALATLRAMLVEATYNESTVAERLGGQNLAGVPRLADGRKSLAGPVEDANAALIRLFLDGESVNAGRLLQLLGVEAVAACERLALLSGSADDSHDLTPTVTLMPVQGLWLASDLIPVSSNRANARQDYVFSAHNELTGHFLSVIPDAPGARVVELCAGTGVAALRAVRRGAASAVAADLVPRSVHFARFNALLNELDDRVDIVESDVWEALDGESFDLVVAHPPYVPALAHRFDFRDAGVDGEQVTRRIFEGVPAHVLPHGRVIVRAALSDRKDAPIAQRIREWLGESAGEFDLVQLETVDYGPMEAYRSVTKGGAGFVDCERWLSHFESLTIERFAICIIELRREAYGRAPLTERRVFGPLISPMVADWHFSWARHLATAGATPGARLAGLAPRVAPGVRLSIQLASDGTGWQTVGALVESDWPSRAAVKLPALAPTLLELCDGTRDVGALLSGLRAAGLVNAEVGSADVAHLVEVLAAAGVLEVPTSPLPPRPEQVTGLVAQAWTFQRELGAVHFA